MPPDTLNEIGVLKRREIEARVLRPVIERLAQEFGRERVIALVREVITEIARTQGRDMAAQLGGNSLAHFDRAMESWRQGKGYDMQILEQTERVYAFNVTRCGYAEMYRQLGIPELGALLSCNRDFALMQGFNPEVELLRTQTIMEGAPHCDFRFHVTSAPPS
jgi:predicted ArsR family transcriptional regulator